MTDSSFFKTLIAEGRQRKLQELVELVTRDREPAEAKRYAAEARAILRDLEDLDRHGPASTAGSEVGDYSGDREINIPIIKFLERIGRPVTAEEITRELVRGRFEGYRDTRKMSIRVGRCIRAYTWGKPKDNPRLVYKDNLVGLPEWPDEMYKRTAA